LPTRTIHLTAVTTCLAGSTDDCARRRRSGNPKAFAAKRRLRASRIFWRLAFLPVYAPVRTARQKRQGGKDNGTGYRKHRHAQSRLALDPLPEPRLPDQCAGPVQRLDRRLDDEQGTWPVGDDLRPRCRRVFLELCAVPGPRQRRSDPHRRSPLARRHDDRVGRLLRRHGVRYRRHQFRYDALPVGHCGIRFLPLVSPGS
jgi:hypothetical protein